MNGKIVGIALVSSGVLAGAGLYYLQVFHFYEELDPEELRLGVATQSGETLPLDARVTGAIDATSSPIRFRACFTLSEPSEPSEPGILTPYPAAEPLTAPFWFECFDAAEIAGALADGSATAFLSEDSIAHGVDRVIALFPDGRGYAWHQLNPEFAE